MIDPLTESEELALRDWVDNNDCWIDPTVRRLLATIDELRDELADEREYRQRLERPVAEQARPEPPPDTSRWIEVGQAVLRAVLRQLHGCAHGACDGVGTNQQTRPDGIEWYCDTHGELLVDRYGAAELRVARDALTSPKDKP